MAEIRRYGLVRHFRSEANFHVVRYSKGKVVQAGRGLAFWFLPDVTSVAQIPMDDREMPFHFTGRTRDYQEVTVQGMMTWLAGRRSGSSGPADRFLSRSDDGTLPA